MAPVNKTTILALLSLISSLAALWQQSAILLMVNGIQYRRRRQMLLNLIEMPLERRRRGRRDVSRQFWIRPGRVRTWWENFKNDTVVANEWRENFRMSKNSFLILCNEVRPFLVYCLFEGDSPVYAKEQKRSSVV